MVVSELIELLRALPGDPDLRHVAVKVIVSRPYAGDITAGGNIRDVSVDQGEASLLASIYIE